MGSTRGRSSAGNMLVAARPTHQSSFNVARTDTWLNSPAALVSLDTNVALMFNLSSTVSLYYDLCSTVSLYYGTCTTLRVHAVGWITDITSLSSCIQSAVFFWFNTLRIMSGSEDDERDVGQSNCGADVWLVLYIELLWMPVQHVNKLATQCWSITDLILCLLDKAIFHSAS